MPLVGNGRSGLGAGHRLGAHRPGSRSALPMFARAWPGMHARAAKSGLRACAAGRLAFGLMMHCSAAKGGFLAGCRMKHRVRRGTQLTLTRIPEAVFLTIRRDVGTMDDSLLLRFFGTQVVFPSVADCGSLRGDGGGLRTSANLSLYLATICQRPGDWSALDRAWSSSRLLLGTARPGHKDACGRGMGWAGLRAWAHDWIRSLALWLCRGQDGRMIGLLAGIRRCR
jgi:hypothetical protein